MFRFLLAALMVASGDALRVATVAPRTSAISMGLSVGDKFPDSALKTCGVSGKKAVIFFYGADDAPSCSKEISAFDAALAEFKESGVSVVGVRNGAGVKEGTDASFNLIIDEDDAIRQEIGIEKDLFGLLGGRETYVLDGSGTVVGVHNNQFDPESHVRVALEAVESLPKSPIDEILDQIKEAVDGLQAALPKA